MSVADIKGKKIYVYGLGKSSLSAMRVLREQGAELFCWDDNSANLQPVFDTQIATPRRPEEVKLSQFTFILKAPGVPMDAPFIADAYVKGMPIVGDMDVFWHQIKNTGATVIGITGTNGKSTTTALVGHVLEAAGKPVAVGGNIGTNVMDLPMLGSDGFYVLEVSSFQLETLHDLHFNAAAITNLTPDHLDRHGSMDFYLALKMGMFKRQDAQDYKIICTDSPELKSVVDDATVAVNATGNAVAAVGADIVVDADGQLQDNGEPIVDCRTLANLPGRHNWQNVAVAWALLKPYISIAEFVAGVRSFNALPHRLEQLQTVGNILFVNDSKATNPESAICALESFENIYWLAGGKPKAEGVKPCLSHLKQVKGAFVYGAAADDFAAHLQPVVPCIQVVTLEEALEAAINAAKGQPNAVVLLSPACASFDQFKSFEARGDLFRDMVAKHAEEAAR